MKRWLCLTVIVGLLGTFGPSLAQEMPGIVPGDRVVVDAESVLIYAQPGPGGDVVEELPRGMVSQVIAAKTGDDGQEWYYLRDNAFGWVPGLVEGAAPLVVYDDLAYLRQMIDQATARIDADPKDDAAYFWRGILYHSLRQNELAFSDVTQAINLSPTNAFYYEFRAKINIERHQPRFVQSDAQGAINLGRTLPATYNRLGIAYDDQDEGNLAVEAYDQALALAPGYGLVYQNKAVAYDHMGLENEGLDLYTQAIEADPLLSLAYINRSLTYKGRGQYEEALEGFNDAIRVDPYNGRAYAYRGVYYEGIERNYQAALDDFNTSIELDPFSGDGWVDRGVFYMQAYGDLAQATSDLEHAAAVDPENSDAYYNLGTAYGYQGRYEEALEAYSKVVALSGSFSVYLYRGQVYLALDDPLHAELDFDTYVQGMSHSSRMAYFNIFAYMMRGAARLHNGDFEGAADDYLAASGVDEDMAKSYSTWFDGWRVTMDREQVLADLEVQLVGDPTNADLRLQVANMNMELGRWSDALLQYDKYLGLTATPPPGVADLAELIDVLFG